MPPEITDQGELHVGDTATPKPPAPTPAPTPVRMTPLEWQRERRTPWPLACLTASVQRWDPQCDEERDLITGDEYDAAVAGATSLVEHCRTAAASLADSTAQRRVFILHHPTEMAAVVAHKPTVAESLELLRTMQADLPVEMRSKQMIAGMWTRVLWPAAGTPEAQALMDQTPISYGNTYPLAYMRSLGMATEDVRKKH